MFKQGQPRGFSIFFLTEMWERYGFYVIQTLLIFYLIDFLKLNDHSSYVIVGAFTSLAYINSIFGGAIADRFIGSSRGIIVGGILLCCGYFILGLNINLITLNIALATISVGTGLLKPNVSSLLSILYPKNDIRKDAGYTLYYVGIYVGAVSGSFLGGYLLKFCGWQITFYSASFAGLMSILVYAVGIFKFKLVDNRRLHPKYSDYLASLIAVVILILVSYYVLESEFLSIFYYIIIAIFCLSLITYNIIIHRGVQRTRLIAFLFLIIFAVFYWAINFQQFFSLSLCIARTCHLNAPASSFPAIESLGIIIFGPLINILWQYLKNRGKSTSIPKKFSLGFLFNALGFVIIALGLWYARLHGEYLNILVIVLAYILMAIGELSLSPTSLSMVSTLVPAHLSSVMMGISLLTIGFGGKLAGFLADNSIINNTNTSLNKTEGIYLHSFLTYFLISITIFITLTLLTKFIHKLTTLEQKDIYDYSKKPR